MAKIRANERKRKASPARTAKPAVPSRGFWSGFVMGLGAAALLGPQEFTPPKYSRDSVSQSWRGAGEHIRNSVRRGDELKTT